MIRFEQGSRFMVRNIKIQNTPGVNLTISNSGKASDATIHDVTIYNPASDTKTEKPSHNTDGISIWGHHVNIYDCNISTGDDNIVCDDNAQYVHVWNCKMVTGHVVSVMELVNTFEKCTGVKLNYQIAPRRAGDIEKIWGNVDKANNVLGWKAVHTLEDALSSAWKWQLTLRERGIM